MAVVLLDLDETLIHDQASTRAACRATLADASAQRGFDPEQAAAAVAAAAARLWADSPTQPYCQRIGISPWEGMWATFAIGDDLDTVALRTFAPAYRRLAWRTGLGAVGVHDEDLVAELAERFVWERGCRQIPFSESVGVMSALRRAGHSLVLVTNGDRDLQRRKLVASGLLPLLDGVVISGVLGIGKPEPAIFAHALGLVGARPEDAVMVGDSPHRDIAGAVASGIRAVWVDRGAEAEKPAGAWHMLQDLRPLPGLLS